MLAIFLISLFIPILLGCSIAYSLVISAMVMMYSKGLFKFDLVAQQFIGGVNSFSLLAVPFFVMAGELMNKGGITRKIVDAVSLWVGRFRGGLGYVSILSSMIFAGLSGSALADTACLGGVLIPMMEKDRYNKGRATGIVVSAAIIANIIPPSIGFILFGVVNSVSITKLFIGGIVPGIILGLLLMSVWWFIARKDGLKPMEDTMTKQEKRAVIKNSIPALILPVFIVVGLRGGIFTATEAGSIACLYALILSLFVYKEMKFKDLWEVFVSTVRTTAKTMFIVGSALTVAWIITASNLTNDIVRTFEPLVEHPVLLVLSCQMIFIIFGMVLDIVPIIMVISPVIMPLVKAAGIDPAYFGILSIITMTFGLITPPVGTVLYVGSGISNCSVSDTIKGALPFMLVEVAFIVFASIFPQIIEVPLSILY